MRRLYIFIILSILCLTACGSHDKFLGTWEKGKAEITIEKERGKYTIIDNISGLPASYSKGNLLVNNGVTQVTIFLDDDGYLNVGGEKYKRKY
ncbi:hypothetical protein [Acetivibrio cellulolyticus]|uniref:hypothetical protein n=1 Tax=Acetivibrio cellulolyticus TaxID=35830 RepID=UPI0001E2F684|nr:hypothetical protein [Acetivibrio cellulolyticus]